jgi:hypothetical protein
MTISVFTSTVSWRITSEYAAQMEDNAPKAFEKSPVDAKCQPDKYRNRAESLNGRGGLIAPLTVISVKMGSQSLTVFP